MSDGQSEAAEQLRIRTCHVFFIGIDPGASGGIARVNMDRTDAECHSFPDTDHDLLNLFRRYACYQPQDNDCFAVIEKLGGMPRSKDGKAMQSPKTMLAMGINYGKLLMSLRAAGIPYEQALPRKWQEEFGLIMKGGTCTTTQKKNVHKQRAIELFPPERYPNVKVTHKTADALLLAEYARRIIGPTMFPSMDKSNV